MNMSVISLSPKNKGGNQMTYIKINETLYPATINVRVLV